MEPVEGLDEGELQRITKASRFGIISPKTYHTSESSINNIMVSKEGIYVKDSVTTIFKLLHLRHDEWEKGVKSYFKLCDVTCV